MRYDKAKEALELYFTITALDRHGWIVSRAAVDLGMTKQGVFQIIKKHGLKQGVKPPSPAAFLIPEGIKLKPIRRVVLLDPLDYTWLRAKGHIGSYSQLIRAGIRALKGFPDRKIRELV
jgi:hypothetical protein